MIITNSDGGARGNPGPAAVGVVVRKGKKILTMYSQKLRKTTNNVAEYEALIRALELARPHGKEVECNVDSELVVKQLLGEYRVKNKKLIPLFLKVQKCQEHFDKVRYKHVRREDKFQQMADALVNQELDK